MEEKRGSRWPEYLAMLTAAGLAAVMMAVIGGILTLAFIGGVVVFIVVQVNRTGP